MAICLVIPSMQRVHFLAALALKVCFVGGY